jgi:hypothetical protein
MMEELARINWFYEYESWYYGTAVMREADGTVYWLQDGCCSCGSVGYWSEREPLNLGNLGEFTEHVRRSPCDEGDPEELITIARGALGFEK